MSFTPRRRICKTAVQGKWKAVRIRDRAASVYKSRSGSQLVQRAEMHQASAGWKPFTALPPSCLNQPAFSGAFCRQVTMGHCPCNRSMPCHPHRRAIQGTAAAAVLLLLLAAAAARLPTLPCCIQAPACHSSLPTRQTTAPLHSCTAVQPPTWGLGRPQLCCQTCRLNRCTELAGMHCIRNPRGEAAAARHSNIK